MPSVALSFTQGEKIELFFFFDAFFLDVLVLLGAWKVFTKQE